MLRRVSLTCTSCMQSFMWDLSKAPLKAAVCPYCTAVKAIQPVKVKKKKRKMLTNAERYPENPGCPAPVYPSAWFLDYHCRSLNNYQKNAYLRVKDKGAAYRALDKAEVTDVRRTDKKIRVTITSYRKKLVDCQSLYGGGTKGLLDILVRRGWVHDDNPQWCDLRIDQEQVLQKDLDAGKNKGTRVILEEVG